MPILRPPSSKHHPSSSKRLLIHNWRTAGTSTSSLLACNLGSSYLKIGVQFDDYGYTNEATSNQQITQLGEIRERIHTSHIVGGHLFAGLNAFLPGTWELWMTARDPIKRAKSGVLRFHGLPYQRSKNPDRDLFSYTGKERIEKPNDLFELFDQSLRFERNGMCRRLSILQLATSFSISNNDNLERIPELSLDYRAEDLYEAARITLDSVRMLILTEWYTPSILCIEAMLKQGSLLCPFSNLRLNRRIDKHVLEQRKQVVENADAVLAQIQSADLLLWKDIQQRFRKQLYDYKITHRQVAVRDLIQSEQLFNPRWFTQEKYSDQDLIRGVSMAIAKRAKEKPELATDVIETMANWQRFTPEAGEQVRHFSHKALAKLTS